MVKADAKRDYYADLDLPCTADQESIKRKFRDLAKQYHPDRNPGHEVDVVPKFQAVQTAHEILSDPVQKAKYDADRAKLNRPNPPTVDPAFKKPAPPTRTNSGFANGSFPQSPPASAPGPRRDPSATRFQPPNGARRPNSSSAGTAETFARFARAAGNQQWDRARFEAAAAADGGLRGMNAMRAGSQSGTQTRRAPTAPRTMADAAPHSAGPGPSPGFPGLGRTPSGRRGFNPAAGGGDEPPSNGTSAYSHTHRSDRPNSGSFGLNPQAQQKPRTAVSPLRQSRSAHFPDVVYAARPGLQRESSRYAQQSGERTFINTSNISRSTSVRNSPIDPRWEDETMDARSAQSPTARAARPRRRSLSPPKAGRPSFAFSASSTSSDDEVTRPSERPKATPRAPRARPVSSTRMFSDDDPALTGHFPGTNYTRLVDESQYNYPPPPNKGPTRKPFPGMPSPLEEPAQDSADKTTDNEAPDQSGSTFDPTRWHDEFGKSEENIFRPNESTARDRRSPNRNNRNSRPAMRKQHNSHEDTLSPTSTREEPTQDARQHVSDNEAPTKAAAFQAGKLNPDWAEQFKSPPSQRRASDTGPSTAQQPNTTENIEPNDSNVSPTTPANGDAMDVDEPQPGYDEVTVEEEESPPPARRGHRRSSTSHSVNGGVHIGGLDNMDDFTKQAPFTPSEAGLDGMGDLHTNLPFPSQASRAPPARRNNSHTLKDLNIPPPPEPPTEPKELTQTSWKAYADAMTQYMHRWTKFDAQMLAHFQARQEQMAHGMYRNWISAQGDGASADSFEHNFGSGHPGERAGYQTYMSWLEDDRKCRAAWDLAFENHMDCMKTLGDVRNRVKARAHVDC